MTGFPSLFPDPAYGLLVQKSMRAGASWNYVIEPRPDNIAQDYSYFYTVWSPGQHAVPGALMSLGLTLGGALRAVNILAALLAIVGWYALLRAMAFERVVALGACLVLTASRTFGFSFLAYVGSDQLAFAGFPYLAWAVLAVRGRWALLLVAPATVLIGFFFKNSLAIYMTAWILAVLTAGLVSRRPQSARGWGRLAAVALGAGAALFLIDWGYVSRGWTPMAYRAAWSTNPGSYLLPAVMPLLAGTGVDDLLSRAFDHPALPRFDYKSALWLLVPVAAGMIAWGVSESRQPIRHESRVTIIGFVAVVVAAFTVLLATGSGASLYLSRHYLIPGAVLLPLLIERLLALRRPLLKGALVLALALPAVYGVLSFGSNWRRHYQHRAAHSGEVGVAHLSLTPRLVQHLRALDRDLPVEGSLVVLPIPSLAFEFSRTRVLATSATSDGIPEFSKVTWGGRVANLVVIAEQAGQTPDEIRAWLRTFAAYDPEAWEHVSVDGFAFYFPRNQRVDAQWLQAVFGGSAHPA